MNHERTTSRNRIVILFMIFLIMFFTFQYIPVVLAAADGSLGYAFSRDNHPDTASAVHQKAAVVQQEYPLVDWRRFSSSFLFYV